ncbi:MULTISPECIES: iron-containing alcohol dehydrogenase [Marinitoga]|uniref:Iron-containing alcohol dehydrogenase n=1 Tax=Marinitoga aeolica TaxID=2809031 RepID=A0ABY8PSJ8_9BACT|nr:MULTISPECIES: iron-containing alcohol dehydrogenase [Marinitoga]MBM7560005.1 alcohol dehydrogenase class IV [Marinitoga litoralis]WGS65616.1 iron-containing alcohol dehydrogenase [Marinitoga aeolica]
MNYQFYMPTKVIIGKNKLEELKNMNLENNIMIVCEKFAYNLGYIDRLKEILDNVFVFDEVEPNPPTYVINNGVKFALENNIKTIIALGGGSSIDTAKAISCLEEDIENPKELKRKTKLIAIPTTSGTGSEVTNVGVYTFSNNLKKPLVTDSFWPDISIVDPTLTYSMPKNVTGSTGLDAFTHAIESYWALSTQNISKSIALKTMKLIFENLEKSIDGDKKARDVMSEASMMAGIAFSQTRTTAAHAISFPLTNIYKIPHGLACALSLYKLIEYVNNENPLEEIINYLELNSINELSSWIKKMIEKSGYSFKLRDYGVNNLEEIADISLKANIIELTPIKIDKEKLMNLLKDIY